MGIKIKRKEGIAKRHLRMLSNWQFLIGIILTIVFNSWMAFLLCLSSGIITIIYWSEMR